MASFKKNGNGIFGTGDDTDGVEVSLAMSSRSRWSRRCVAVPDGEGFEKGISEATGVAKGKLAQNQKLYQYHFYSDISVGY